MKKNDKPKDIILNDENIDSELNADVKIKNADLKYSHNLTEKIPNATSMNCIFIKNSCLTLIIKKKKNSEYLTVFAKISKITLQCVKLPNYSIFELQLFTKI